LLQLQEQRQLLHLLVVLLKTGDHIVASSSLYGTFNLLNTTAKARITTTFVDPSDATNFTKAAKENTKFLLKV
jgi:O-acetylhomoserine (thiol)-lyase